MDNGKEFINKSLVHNFLRNGVVQEAYHIGVDVWVFLEGKSIFVKIITIFFD